MTTLEGDKRAGIIPDFDYCKQCAAGREERIQFIISEVKKNPVFNFEAPAYTKERCLDLNSINDTIENCTRLMHYAPQSRKDIHEQILIELKIV